MILTDKEREEIIKKSELDSAYTRHYGYNVVYNAIKLTEAKCIEKIQRREHTRSVKTLRSFSSKG